jgi:UDP-2,3-diacylglucosamine pyrophosphatase LpxH
VALAESLEQRMRRTNLAYKQAFPEEQVRAFAASRFAEGHDVVVLGHFHVEKDLETERGRILVLPEWRESRRHLVARTDGAIVFVDSG